MDLDDRTGVEAAPRAASLDPFDNRLLAALSEATRARVEATFDIVALERHQFTNLYDAPMQTVDFPIDAVMSVVATLTNGSICEVATVGREGFVEVDAALASRVAQRSSFCQIAGHVARMPIDTFVAELAANPEFEALVFRAVRARAFLTEQLATCNLKHTVIERFARWLLMTRDRLAIAEFRVTHEFLGMMLGARRASVSQAAATLQAAGCITYRRGTMMILDHALLAARACECYAAERDAIEACFREDD
ncbi:MAG TPA: Crp/Fnr family transcriptional regulator [Candidatus Elarobacter sp.]|nr:Crp/Fnr family transcriptional regulator [Candidatus Elarobacter sp.]